MNLLKNKKFKYGSAAVALTVVVIAIVIVMNVIIFALAAHFGWYADISSSGMFRFSDESLDMLDTIDGENNKITVYFFSDKNNLAATDYGNYVLSLTNELENRYDFVSVSYKNLNKDLLEIAEVFGQKNEYAQTFTRMYENREFSIGTMVIRNDTYAIGEDGSYNKNLPDYRISVFSITDMYSESGVSFLGDYILTARMMSVCNLTPTAYFLTGHGEMTVAEDQTYGNAEYMADIFETCGFKVDKINLGQENFSQAETAKPSVALIFAPQSDYTQTELDRLSAFVEGGGHLMMFADGIYRQLDNLNGFLSEYGVSLAPAKFKSGMDASLGEGDFTFAAETNGESPVIQAITDRSGKVVVSDCRVLRLDETKGASAVLLPPASATLNGNDTEKQGNEAVAAVSCSDGRGNVFVCGSASLASSLIYVPNYYNRDVLLSVLQQMGAEDVPLNLEIKTLATDGLDLTRGQAVLLTVVVSAIPALVFVTVGAFVYVRRKKS